MNRPSPAAAAATLAVAGLGGGTGWAPGAEGWTPPRIARLRRRRMVALAGGSAQQRRTIALIPLLLTGSIAPCRVAALPFTAPLPLLPRPAPRLLALLNQRLPRALLPPPRSRLLALLLLLALAMLLLLLRPWAHHRTSSAPAPSAPAALTTHGAPAQQPLLQRLLRRQQQLQGQQAWGHLHQALLLPLHQRLSRWSLFASLFNHVRLGAGRLLFVNGSLPPSALPSPSLPLSPSPWLEGGGGWRSGGAERSRGAGWHGGG
ncbi:hypothetical protein CLOM_g7269 [Closterium sp. NIES-68]|nr:hypothetical protein CLOM_g7269 [Closterium sp. NIES-68]